MTEEEYVRRKQYAGPTKPSMHRRRIGHDYSSRRMYLITMTVEGRQPLLGTLKGTITGTGPEGCSVQVLPSPLGRRVQEEWYAVTAHHPEVAVIAFQLMPDHVHGILFVRAAMNQHLGAIVSGFKAGTNRAYRELYGAAATAPPHSQPVATVGSATVGSGAVGSAAVGCAGAVGSAAVGSAAVGSAAVGSAGAVGSAAVGSAGAVGCAAASPQRKRDRSHENRHHGFLWSPGYNDHVLSNEGELERWKQYLADNPRRLFLRRQHPELFRVHFGVRIGRFNCTAVGNRFLLEYPRRRQVQHSTHLYETDIQKAVAENMAAARGGAVLVSPSISEGEKRSMRAAFDAELPLILITANGLGLYTKPGGAFFDACAEGRLLVVSPFEHQNRKVTLTRQMCMEMNELAHLIAESSGSAATQPTQGSVNAQPAQGTVNAKPTQGSVNAQPAQGSAATQPTQGSVNAQPTQGTVIARLTQGTVAGPHIPMQGSAAACSAVSPLVGYAAASPQQKIDNNPRTKNNETEAFLNGLSGLVNDNERSKEPHD